MKRIYFVTAIVVAIILGIIGFLLIKVNTKQQTDAFYKSSVGLSNDNKKQQNPITINFENEDNLPLKKNVIIPQSIVIKENEIYLPIKRIIFNHKVDLSYFEKINNNKLSKIVTSSVIVRLTVKKQYRQWFTINQLNEKILKQVNFPSKYLKWVIDLAHNKSISEQEFSEQLKLTLFGSNKKYLDLLKKFMVLFAT